MNPEILQKIQSDIEEIKGRLDALQSDSTLPMDVAEAMRARIGLLPTGAAAQTVAIPAGGGTAAKAPDGNYITPDGKLVPFYNPS